MSIAAMSILLFGSLLVLLALGLPVSFCMGGVAAAYCLFFWGETGFVVVIFAVLNNIKTLILIAIPLFIFMGMMLERSGIADALYGMMHDWVGGLKGGLAMGTVLICTMFAAMTGISGAATVSMGLIALPAMLKRGYDKKIAMGSIMAGGALGPLIPPSIMMIMFGFIALESVGRLFAGGILPGLLLVVLFIIYIAIRCYLKPDLGPSLPVEERANLKEKIISLRGIILPILLIILVLGSIFSGFATPTEGAAVGAFGAMLCAAIYRRLTWETLKETCYRTMKLSVMVMWIVIGATAFSTVYTFAGAPALITEVITGLDVPPIAIILLMQLVLIILGCFMDPSGILFICAPIFVPIVRFLGFDIVWFGVLWTVNMELAYLTPPYGFNLFYMRGVVPPGITMADIYRAALPFVLIQFVGLVMVVAFPQIILLVPNLIFGVR